jgi:hypothetical protein
MVFSPLTTFYLSSRDIWRMKRRGLWIYGISQLVWIFLWVFYFNAFPKIGQIILLVVFGLIVLIYYKEMS